MATQKQKPVTASQQQAPNSSAAGPRGVQGLTEVTVTLIPKLKFTLVVF